MGRYRFRGRIEPLHAPTLIMLPSFLKKDAEAAKKAASDAGLSSLGAGSFQTTSHHQFIPLLRQRHNEGS
jgi:hypothetical protein